MGIMTVHDANEVAGLNRRQRNKMAVGQGGPAGHRRDRPGRRAHRRDGCTTAVAEPVVYMIDRYVVGGFYRVHAGRGIDENLNAPGMHFVPLAFSESAHLPQAGAKPGASAPNRFYMYGVIGRLAMVAASYELEATDPDAETYE